MNTLLKLKIEEIRHANGLYPNQYSIHSFIKDIYGFLFKDSIGDNDSFSETISSYENRFNEIIKKEDAYIMAGDKDKLAKTFFIDLITIADQCHKDALAILAMDPAAESFDEVISTYPGFYAIAVYRIAHCWWLYDMKFSARIATEYAHSQTGIDIHPAAIIGNSFAIDHGTGIVIGETTIIGDNVKLYQGVTLGALQVSKSLKTQKRHPTIGNFVTIYANATILGGDTIIGAGSTIGGNVWLTRSIPPCSIVYQKRETIVKEK